LFRALARFRPSFCFNYTIKASIYGSLAAPLLGIKAVALITGLGYVFLSHGVRSALARELYRLALSFSSEVWFLNEDDRQVFLARGLVRETKTSILPGEGIDTARFSPMGPREPDGRTVFLMLSRLLYDKGVGEYFQAARALRTARPETVFRLAGAPGVGNKAAVPTEELDVLVADGTIEYLGKVDDVRTGIAAADFVVLPSYREGLPRSLLEAASMGIPIITTDVAGCRELVVEGENGFLAEARSAGSLVEAMERALRLGPAQARAMGARGREMVLSRYGDERIVERYKKRMTGLGCR
jgi:glycosyltransferase involved in cell wall biosynthesis